MLVSHDAPAELKAFAEIRKIGYTMLSDAKAEIIPAFGIANPQYARGSAWYGIALPMIFAVGPDGVVRHRFSTARHGIPVDIDTVLDTLKKDAGG